jgi:hypothetical protein
MMEVHGFRVDERLERGIVVGKRWKFVSHTGNSPSGEIVLRGFGPAVHRRGQSVEAGSGSLEMKRSFNTAQRMRMFGWMPEGRGWVQKQAALNGDRKAAWNLEKFVERETFRALATSIGRAATCGFLQDSPAIPA